ncbi:MAG: YARHG domain-containing protein, partial [Clostridia bacterium]|nr:YARHG domain-containing protein [Clostridia bacterium]
IYARHGYTFDDDLADYFENNHEWYMPITSDKPKVEAKFNSIEKRNIKIIEEYQKQKGWRQ